MDDGSEKQSPSYLCGLLRLPLAVGTLQETQYWTECQEGLTCTPALCYQ